MKFKRIDIGGIQNIENYILANLSQVKTNKLGLAVIDNIIEDYILKHLVMYSIFLKVVDGQLGIEKVNMQVAQKDVDIDFLLNKIQDHSSGSSVRNNNKYIKAYLSKVKSNIHTYKELFGHVARFVRGPYKYVSEVMYPNKYVVVNKEEKEKYIETKCEEMHRAKVNVLKARVLRGMNKPGGVVPLGVEKLAAKFDAEYLELLKAEHEDLGKLIKEAEEKKLSKSKDEFVVEDQRPLYKRLEDKVYNNVVSSVKDKERRLTKYVLNMGKMCVAVDNVSDNEMDDIMEEYDKLDDNNPAVVKEVEELCDMILKARDPTAKYK